MDTLIIAAIITSSATILAALITIWGIKKKKSNPPKGISINKNKNLKIIETRIKGDVSINANKNSEIGDSDLNGE